MARDGRLALLSFHSCPVGRLGEKDAGGMNIYVLQIAREVAQMGREVDVFTRSHDSDHTKIVDVETGARVVHLDAGPCDAPKDDLYHYTPKFVTELLEFQKAEGVDYDLIHSHYWLSGSVGMTLSREWNIPHVVTFHTLAKTKMRARVGERESQLRQDVESLVTSDADGIVVSTDEERQDLVRLYRAEARKIAIIPPGVNLEMFHPVDRNDTRARLGIEEQNVVLYVGRIEPLKGVDILLRAVPMLECAQDLRVMVVGGSPGNDAELERLKSLTVKLGIADSVTFTGSVPQHVLPDYYSAADVFVLPSHSESFGLAPLEAMACGTPVVVSRVGGLKTFVKNGETGYLVPWRRPESFAQRLDVLLASPKLRQVMGKAARAKALSMGWGAVAERMLTYYSKQVEVSWAGLAGD